MRGRPHTVAELRRLLLSLPQSVDGYIVYVGAEGGCTLESVQGEPVIYPEQSEVVFSWD